MTTKDENSQYCCSLCNIELASKYKLINHIKRVHSYTWERYVLETRYDNICPRCACGCGRNTKLSGTSEQFNSYIHGHNKVEHSTEIRKKIGAKNAQNTKRYFAEHPEEAFKRAANMRQYLTEETEMRRLISIRLISKDPEHRQQIGERTKKFWNDNPEKRIIASQKSKETYARRNAAGCYDGMKQHLSDVMCEKLLRNERIWQRGEYTGLKNKKNCRYKSSYELKAMKELDDIDFVMTWDYECFSLRYIDDKGQWRRHVPDFLITLDSAIIIAIEVKPKKLIPLQRAKLDAARDFCEQQGWHYIIWEPSNGPIKDVLSNYRLMR